MRSALTNRVSFVSFIAVTNITAKQDADIKRHGQRSASHDG